MLTALSPSCSPRNWLLLSDVLGRLRMTSRSFRRLFPQLNVQSIPEDEFYRQASLSQLLTGPDEQELASFRPDIKDPLELVEATPELAGMLGSSLEFVDTRYLESSPPPTPPPPLNLPPEQQLPPSSKTDGESQNTTVEPEQLQGLRNAEISLPAAKTETKMIASMWEVQQQASKNPGGDTSAKSNMTINVNMWEPSKDLKIANSASKVESNTWQLQRQSSVAAEHVNSVHSDPGSRVAASEAQSKSHPDCGTLEQRSLDAGNANSASPETKMDTSAWQQQQLGNYSTTNSAAAHDVKVTQRLRCRNAGSSGADAPSGTRQTLTNCDPADSNGTTGGKQQRQTKTLDAPETLVDGTVWDMQRLRSKSSGTVDPKKSTATVDVSKWKQQEIKITGSNGAATKREASFCDLGQGAKSIKLDPAWQRSLGNVRVHIRDLGMKVVGGTTIQRDLKKEQGKVSAKAVRAKTRS